MKDYREAFFSILKADDKSESVQKAIEIIENENDFGKALKELDFKCNIERNLIQPLVKNNSDYLSGIMNLTKSLRNLYTHAYQSYLWNYVASKRVNLYGNKICNIKSYR